jgi:sugar phosphate isomerase/epimerase
MVDFSFQLYSARKFPPLDSVLKRLAEIGYKEVEGYGAVYEDPNKLADLLKANGLTMPTGHFGLDLLKDTDKAMGIARTVGIRTLICPAVPQAERSQPDAGWKALAETLARLNETYTKAGFGFGWHNHAFEFKPTETGACR